MLYPPKYIKAGLLYYILIIKMYIVMTTKIE